MRGSTQANLRPQKYLPTLCCCYLHHLSHTSFRMRMPETEKKSKHLGSILIPCLKSFPPPSISLVSRIPLGHTSIGMEIR